MLHNNSTHSLLFFLFFFMGGGGWGVLFLPIFSVYFLQACLVKQAPLLPYPPPLPSTPIPPNPSTPTAWVPASIYFGSLPSRGWEKRQVLADADDSLQVSEHCICLCGSALSLSLSVPEDTLTLPSFCLFCSSLLPPPPTPQDLPFSRLNLALKKRVNALYSEWAVHLGLCAFSEQFCYWSLALAVFFCVAACWLCMHLCAFSDKHLYQHLFTLSLCCCLFGVLFECLLCTISI